MHSSLAHVSHRPLANFYCPLGNGYALGTESSARANGFPSQLVSFDPPSSIFWKKVWNIAGLMTKSGLNFKNCIGTT